MIITMFTDISMIHGMGAYGVWAAKEGQMFRHADIFRRPVSDINIAEICGVINGLSIVIKRTNPPSGTKIIAQSVSETAVQVLQGSNRHPSFDPLIKSRNALLADTGVTVSYILMRRKDIRISWNEWCSKEPKRILLEHLSVAA